MTKDTMPGMRNPWGEDRLMHCDVTGFPVLLCYAHVTSHLGGGMPCFQERAVTTVSGTAGRGAGLILSEGLAGEPTLHGFLSSDSLSRRRPAPSVCQAVLRLGVQPWNGRTCRWQVGKQGLATTWRDKAQGGAGRDAPSTSEVKVTRFHKSTHAEPHRDTLCCWDPVPTRFTMCFSVLTSCSSVTGTLRVGKCALRICSCI